MTNMHEIVRKHIESAKVVETAGRLLVEKFLYSNAPMKTGKGVAATGETPDRKTALALKKAIASKFAMNPYELKIEIVEKGRTRAVVVYLGPGKGKARQDTTIAGMKKYLKQRIDAAVVQVEKTIAPAAKAPAAKAPVAKAPAGKKPAAPAAGKAPKGTGKLKAFMKENGIDVKMLKTMMKFIVPAK